MSASTQSIQKLGGTGVNNTLISPIIVGAAEGPDSSATTSGGALSGNVTLTVAEVMQGFYAADPNGSNRTVTFPTLALLTAAGTGPLQVNGQRLRLVVYNSGGANTLTGTAGTGCTVQVADTGDAAVAAGKVGAFEFVRVTSSSIIITATAFA